MPAEGVAAKAVDTVAPSAAAEFVCTLQPRLGSDLTRRFAVCRKACQLQGFGLDATDLYPPHITVTGFFTATQCQAAEVCALASEQLKSLAAGSAPSVAEMQQSLGGSGQKKEEAPAHTTYSAEVEMLQVMSTDTGYVLVDVEAPGMACFAKSLAEKARALGVNLRPKAVRHVSLAAGRGSDEQAGIMSVYKAMPMPAFDAWDLVVSQLLVKSDLGSLQRDGKAHHFQEIMRTPMPGVGKGASPDDLPDCSVSTPPLNTSSAPSFNVKGSMAQGQLESAMLAAAATPMKRRRSLPPEPCSIERLTPPFKLTSCAARRRAML